MKRLQLILVGIIVAASLCACSGNTKSAEQRQNKPETAVEENVEADSDTVEEDSGQNTDEDLKQKSDSEESVENTEEETTEAAEADDFDESETVFDPQDVSDETIESIVTYGDYLIMYKMIVEDYIAKYEAVVKDTLLYDEDAFQQMKDEMDESFEEQEEEYGEIKDQKIIGKESLVEFLKEYRDSLQEVVDTYEETLSAF